MEAAQLVDYRAVYFHVLFLKELAQRLLAQGPFLALVAAQQCAYLAFCLGCVGVLYPFGLDVLRARREYLHLVSALQLVAQRHEFVVDLCAYAVAAEERVYGECEVERGSPRRHGLYLALGGEDKDFVGEQVELYRVEKVECVGLRVVKDFLYGVKPL